MITYPDAPLPKFGDYSTLGIGTPGEIVVVAGQMGADGTGAFPTSDGAEQVKATFDNLGAALAAAGLGFEHVTMARIYLTAFERDYAGLNAIWPSFFEAGKLPARTTVGVTGLAVGAIVEIDLVVRRTPA